MLLFYGENSPDGPISRVEGEYIGEAYDVMGVETTYLVTGKMTEGMIIIVRLHPEAKLWGVEVQQMAHEARIPWPTFLRMDRTGESVVLEVEAPETVEVKVI